MMEIIPVVSSNVTVIGYDEEKKVMVATFVSGVTYSYQDVSREEYLSIIEDVSVGSKLRKVTKDKNYHKVS